MTRPTKRPRVAQGSFEDSRSAENDPNVCDLLCSGEWQAAVDRLKRFPEEASSNQDPSPLALACRHGAPSYCVQAILELCPLKLRHLLDSRGTPLHEAIVCEDIGPEVIDLLLREDLRLGTSSRRATMMQDVDGFTPLHLLIRRRFQSHVLGTPEEGNLFMELLDMLVRNSPEATIVPDRGEYEEPPIVMALKANVYAPLLPHGDTATALVERKINEMVDCMLQYYPNAASCVFRGHRGKYTALHSAVFHGRCAETIELLIQAEQRSPSGERPALLANTQGEMPLHFCAMRGEPPRSVALIASAAPEAVGRRDASGLTPIHWLWIRLVSTLLSHEDGDRGGEISIPLRRRDNDHDEYVSFATLIQGDFEQDLTLVRSLDPPVDFIRMRHIPNEVLDEAEALEYAEKTVEILSRVRERYYNGTPDDEGMVTFSRTEAVASLFWTKLVSMLRSSWTARSGLGNDGFSLVRAAFESPSCPPPVARIVAMMYPNEMSLPDQEGRLPLHHAAQRPWHAWDWPRQDETSENANTRLLQMESAFLLRTAMSLSPLDASARKDDSQCLPIHHSVRTFVRACCSSGRLYSPLPVADFQELLHLFVQLNPDSLHEPDPITGLPPFLQAAAVATDTSRSCSSSSFPDELAVTVVYQLLHEDPALVTQKKLV